MAETKSKTKRTPKPEPKLKAAAPVRRFEIPARYEYCESPVDIASRADSVELLKKEKPEATLEGVIIGEFIAVRNEGCDETFIIHRDVLKELSEAVA